MKDDSIQKKLTDEEFIKELKITVDKLDLLLKESERRNINLLLDIHGEHDVHKGIILCLATKNLI